MFELFHNGLRNFEICIIFKSLQPNNHFKELQQHNKRLAMGGSSA